MKPASQMYLSSGTESPPGGGRLTNTDYNTILLLCNGKCLIKLCLTYCPIIIVQKDHLEPFIHLTRRTILAGSISYKSCMNRDINSVIP